jgi:hypothetical protein
MTGDCCRSLRPELPVRPRGAARAPLLALASALLTGLLPKCPLCVAAYLSAFGVSVGTAGVALGLLRPLGFALAALGLAFSVLRWAHRANVSVDTDTAQSVRAAQVHTGFLTRVLREQP